MGDPVDIPGYGSFDRSDARPLLVVFGGIDVEGCRAASHVKYMDR